MGSISAALNDKKSPYGILLLAVGLLVFVLSTVKPGVFFSGDGGLKFLVASQLEHFSEYKHIVSAHPGWVQDIWNHGYYPFAQPFVYTINNDHVVTFPIYFEFLSGFFYRHFGYYGLYVVPATSVILTWISFLNLQSTLGLRNSTKSISLFILAFCTPLSFYGAVFWEHSLAVFLFFNAVSYFIQASPSTAKAIISGLLAGMAIWFREEIIILLALTVAVMLWNYLKSRRKQDLFFILGVGIPLVFYFIFNQIVYGNYFGLHAQQILSTTSYSSQAWKGFKHLFRLNWMQLCYFPLFLECFVIFILLARDRNERRGKLFQLLLIIILFHLITPFLLPSDGDKQWGSRFLLATIPASVSVLAIFADKNNWEKLFREHKIALWIILIVLTYSVYLNAWKAGHDLHKDYGQRVYPALQYIDAHSSANIIVNNQYVSQELTQQFRTRNFFLVNGDHPFNSLVEQLKLAGQRECLIISIDNQKTFYPPGIGNDKNTAWERVGSYWIMNYDIP